MIRAFYGLTQDPFDHRGLELLPQQQEIYDILKVHCQQGGLCLVLGVPGTGKSVIKQSLQRLPENQHLVATVARTLHTYANTVKILCNACRIEFENSAFKCERRLIEQAFSLNHAGKSLTTVLDDAHLMDLENLRKLRLLFDDFPKNHNLVLIGHPCLLANLDLGVNQDIKSRVTYSVIVKRLNADDMRDFILRELDRAGLGHNIFTRPALDLIGRSADGVLRKARNLCVGCLIEAGCPLPRSDRILGRLLPICDRIGGCLLHREFGKRSAPEFHLAPRARILIGPRRYPALPPCR
jgi:MSHA biogenesis protein MshM